MRLPSVERVYRTINRMQEWFVIIFPAVNLTYFVCIFSPFHLFPRAWEQVNDFMLGIGMTPSPEEVSLFLMMATLGVIHTILLRVADRFIFPHFRKMFRYRI